MSRHEAEDASPTGRLGQIAGSPGLMLAAGALAVLIGLLILAWPGATVRVIAWLVAVQLLVGGVLQLVSVFSADRGPGGRVLFTLLGALSILVGLLCLRAPLQTALVLGLLIGALWLVQGIGGVVDALGRERGAGRGWAIVSGVLSMLGGTIVLVFPGTSLVVLTWLFGIVLVVLGVVLIAQGALAHRARTPAAAVAPPT